MDKKNLILIVIIIVLLLIIVSGIILYIFVLNKPAEPKHKEREISKDMVEIPFSSFVNNVKDSKKVTKLTIKFEVETEIQPILENRTTEIRDAINLIMRNKTEQDLAGAEGQLKLKEEILTKVREILRLFPERKIFVFIDELIAQ
ncbi:MAG: flagellar basal body-associated FliL family protein [Bacillota bacterium]